MREELIYKKFYDIKDIADIFNKDTQTIRSWEIKGIIKKPPKNPFNQWRRYTRKDLMEILNCIINHPWKRTVIKNMDEIKQLLEILKMNPL